MRLMAKGDSILVDAGRAGQRARLRVDRDRRAVSVRAYASTDAEIANRNFGRKLEREEVLGVGEHVFFSVSSVGFVTPFFGHLDLMLGSYTKFVAGNAPRTFVFETMFFLMFFLWRCGGMMLLGMSLYKSGFLDGRLPAPTYARIALIATPVGLALALIGALELERVAYLMPIRAAVDLWNYVGAVFASIGYAATLIWIVKRGTLAGLRRRFAAVGQMALSNYLFHSMSASVLFLGWGLGLAGRFDYAAQLLIVVAVWIVQLIVSPIWLKRFRFGPAEWLWRTLTYGRVQPMRQEASALAPLVS